MQEHEATGQRTRSTSMMGRVWLFLGVLSLLMQGSLRAETLPAKGAIDSRIRKAFYSPDEVFKLYGFVGFHLDIEFERDESFVSIAGGDLDALTYSAHENVLTLKPKVVSTDMNLAVTTTKRRYYFDYTAAVQKPSNLDHVMYAVRFEYPKVVASASVEDRIESGLAHAVKARERNADYWYCGNQTLRPLSAFDDGVQTRLTFAAKRELPARFRYRSSFTIYLCLHKHSITPLGGAMLIKNQNV